MYIYIYIYTHNISIILQLTTSAQKDANAQVDRASQNVYLLL